MSAPTYCWSTDEEEFHGDLPTRTAALSEGEANLSENYEPGETATVWTAQVKHSLHFLRGREHRIGEHVVEQLDEWLYDDISSDDTIIALARDKQDGLGKLILDYLEEHASFNRYGIDNIEKHEVTLPPEEQL